MHLDRNVFSLGKGKYGLILVRNLRTPNPAAGEIKRALAILEKHGIIDWGEGENDFFVIRLRDIYAVEALDAYASAVLKDGDDPEYAKEINDLANKALAHPHRQRPT